MMRVLFNNTHITGTIGGNTDSNTLIPYPANINQANIKDVNIISLNPNSNENTQAYVRGISFESTGIRILLHTNGSTSQAYTIRYSAYYV
jgi:hypothetical protein